MLNTMKSRSWNIRWSSALALSALLIFSACEKDDEPTLGNAPTQADAAFTYAATAQSDNIIEFTATNSSLDATWDLGNGSTAQGSVVQATYPFAGTYTVTLTVQNSGGSATSSQQITIAQDDPSLISNPLFDLLTGGAAGPGYKTWAVDSASDAHFGVGPDPIGAAGRFPEWYAAKANEKAGADMYNDRYTFKLQGFGFDQVTGGGVYVNTVHAGDAPFDDTTASPVADFIAAFPDQLGETWTLDEGADTTLTISGDAMIGYWAGTRTYTIISISENELWLSFVDTKAANPGLTWYVRLVPEGYNSNPGGGGGGQTWSLPMDFESVEPTWTTFGNSSQSYLANPDQSGINTSAKVLETTHGNETWAGLFVDLDGPLDFTTTNTLKLKVWAPDTGTFRIKLEEQANTNNFIEVDATVTTASTWQELTFDCSAAPAEVDRLVIFPGWNTTVSQSFYVDDIRQE